MSTFDAAAFENMVIEEANETKMTPVPEGQYKSLIEKAEIRTIEIKNGDRAGQTVPILNVVHDIQDDDGELKKILNRDKVTVRQDIWLDVDDNGSLSFGPNLNVGLGRLREATGLNKPGKKFSFGMLEGQGPLRIYVTEQTREDTGDVFNRVPKVEAWTD